MFKKKTNSENLLIIDIRSSSVGIGLLDVSKRNKIKSLYSERFNLLFEQKQNIDTFTDSIFLKLRNGLQSLVAKGLINFSEQKIKTYVFYASPWYISTTKQVSISKKKPFKFNNKILDEILLDESKSYSDEYSADLDLIEKDILNVNINGYDVTDPYNKEVKKLNLSFYYSLISKSTRQSVERVIKEEIPKAVIHHRTQPLALFVAVRNMFLDQNSFVIFDLGGEVTDLIIVNNNSISNIVTLPYGKNHLIRDVINSQKLSYHTALCHLETSARNEIKKDPKISDIILEHSKKIIDLIIENTEIEKMPNKIFVISDYELEHTFDRILKSDEFKKKLLRSEKPYIINIDENKLISSLKFDSKVDKFIGLETLMIKTI